MSVCVCVCACVCVEMQSCNARLCCLQAAIAVVGAIGGFFWWRRRQVRSRRSRFALFARDVSATRTGGEPLLGQGGGADRGGVRSALMMRAARASTESCGWRVGVRVLCVCVCVCG
jgi:hypothetical protein